LLNTLEVRLCRGRHRDNRITEGSVELCQEGIERVQGVHRRNSILSSGKTKHLKFCGNSARRAFSSCIECTEKNSLSSSEKKEKCHRRDTHRVTEYSVKLSKEGLSRRSSGGHQISL
jgi:hypothetical protein